MKSDHPAKRRLAIGRVPKRIDAGDLCVAYEAAGTADGFPVVLLHGFPYDVHAFDDVALRLGMEGARVIVPYLRGFGTTTFLQNGTLRSGQQAALGADLVALLDALAIPSATLAGYDWGGRAACIVAALHPERAAGLVSVGSYNIQNIASANQPDAPRNEHRLWYQYYFHGERGRAGLQKDRQAFCRLLWQLWSPTWRFDDATYDRSSVAFDNPDFVEVVIHSYRHRFGLVDGDPRFENDERLLARRPAITVPSITLDGADDGVARIGGTANHAAHFTGRHEHRVIAGAGHNLPQEAPVPFANAILEVAAWAKRR